MENYLRKSALHPTLITTEPNSDLGLIVTIPCRDEPNIEATLLSLMNCNLPDCATEVILLINDSIVDTDETRVQNQKTLEYTQAFADKHNTAHLKIFPFYFSNIPKKKSGVGCARKIARDHKEKIPLLISE